MIDFRYHLVSLVSVFMALAIGVVLGAGPLRESIGDTLTNQVDALRRDKENLQLAVGNRDEQIRDRDQFISAVSDDLVGQQLGGRSVVVVTLPSAGGDAVDAVVDEIEAAGATVTGRVAVREEWIDPDTEERRTALATQLAPALDLAPPTASTEGSAEESEADVQLAGLLAQAVATPDIADAGEPDADGVAVLEELRGADLVSVDGDPTRRATLVVLAAGGPDVAVGEETEDTASDGWLPLVEALDLASAGEVVGGPMTATEQGGVLRAVREDDVLAAAASTVDDVDTPAGRVNVVLALREQLSGGVGHYGFGEGATAVVPDVTAPVPPQP